MTKSMENVFINKKWIIFKTQSAILFQSPYLDHEGKIGIWIYKKYIFDGKYQNQICIGIDKTKKYQIYKYSILKDSKVIAIKKGSELIEQWKIFKENEKENYFKSIKE